MKLKDKIQEDLVTAMKTRDHDRLNTLRFLRAAIKNAEIDAGELNDQAVEKIITKQVKEIDEALSELQKTQRPELVASEKKKKEILESYLPEQLSDDELKAIIKNVQQESGLDHPGKLTGLVLKEAAGRADGGRVSKLIREIV